MNQTKFNPKIIENSLFWYGSIVTITTFGIIFTDQSAQKNLLPTLLIFTPPLLYFTSKIFSSTFRSINKKINENTPKHRYFGDFSFMTFFSQNDNSFAINILLISIAISLICFKISFNIIK